MTGFVVNQPGILSLIQDGGRFGLHNIGLTTGGPVDVDAFRWANRLLNNDLNTTAIEVSIGGLILEAQVETRIALTGAEMPLKINEKQVDSWRSHDVKRGDMIEVGFSQQGLRCYFAVAGGFDVTPSFGSTSTVTREKLGGLNGGRLEQYYVLPCKQQPLGNNYKVPDVAIPDFVDHVVLRTIPGYQQKHFSDLSQRMFYSSEFTVSERCDRMGYRLLGPKIRADIDGILSEGICHGAVQIPADGQPIVLMNDRQTIGGYPKIGSVISLDTAKLSQLGQGGRVQFEPISMEAAHNINHLEISLFERTELVKV